MDQYKDFIKQTLQLINYPQNHDQFVNTFFETAQQEAFLQLLGTLPQDKQDELTKRLQFPPVGDTPEKAIQAYFTPLDCSIALQEAILEDYKKFVQQTMSTLPPEKQKQLQDFLLPLVNSAG